MLKSAAQTFQPTTEPQPVPTEPVASDVGDGAQMGVALQPADLVEQCSDRPTYEWNPAAKPVFSSDSPVEQPAALPLQTALVAYGSQPVDVQPYLTRPGRVSKLPERLIADPV